MEPRYNEDCSICLEPLYLLQSGETLMSTPCEHVFHCHCLSQWLENGEPGNCCPLCKRRVRRTQATPVSLEQAVSVARRSTRPATMISTMASDAASTASRPTTASSRPSRRSRAQENEMPMTSTSFRRNVRRFMTDQGSLRVFERFIEALSQRFQEWQPDAADVEERLHELQQQFQQVQEQYDRVDRDHRQVQRSFADVQEYYRGMLGRYEGLELELSIPEMEERCEILEHLLGIQDSFLEFQNRYVAIQRQELQVLRRMTEIRDQFLEMRRARS